jgi:hypothetical protein
MSTHRHHVTHPALPTSQGSLWPLEAAAPNARSSLESLLRSSAAGSLANSKSLDAVTPRAREPGRGGGGVD